jgi:hypothetical protein
MKEKIRMKVDNLEASYNSSSQILPDLKLIRWKTVLFKC